MRRSRDEGGGDQWTACVGVGALTEEPLVILSFSSEEPVNPLDGAKLHLHVCQVSHHPVHVVGHLRGGGGGGVRLQPLKPQLLVSRLWS